MDTIATRLQERSKLATLNRVLVVAAYEDFVTGVRVNELCRGLARELGPQCNIIKQMWLLNLLRLPQLRAIATEDAASADLIIVSFHDAETIPLELRDWVETWPLSKKEFPQLLLALFDCIDDEEPPRGLHAYLESVAANHYMSFFVQTYEMAARGRAD
jgi:hypothetical protein